MTLIGLSIFVVSISFLCYRHPPSSWTFLAWLQRPSILGSIQDEQKPPASATNHDRQPARAAIPKIIEEEPIKDEKAELDRRAMPPPPPPVFKKPSPTKPSPLAPSLNLIDGNDDNEGESNMRIPSFPAANSAQRASSSTTPSFPAANSAQRASGGTNSAPRLSALKPPPSSPAAANNLMAPPPPRGPLPNRRPPANATSSLAPPPTHTAIPAKPRKKVLLTPGHSPLDWARLSTSSAANLRGVPASTPYIRVPPSLLKQYTGRKGKDAWTVLDGKVYNITAYLPYHPGGEPELMRCAGRDGTRLFGEVHPWVNWEGMLEPCMVGIAVEEGEGEGLKGGSGGGVAGGLEEMD